MMAEAAGLKRACLSGITVCVCLSVFCVLPVTSLAGQSPLEQYPTHSPRRSLQFIRQIYLSSESVRNPTQSPAILLPSQSPSESLQSPPVPRPTQSPSVPHPTQSPPNPHRDIDLRQSSPDPTREVYGSLSATVNSEERKEDLPELDSVQRPYDAPSKGRHLKGTSFGSNEIHSDSLEQQDESLSRTEDFQIFSQTSSLTDSVKQSNDFLSRAKNITDDTIVQNISNTSSNRSKISYINEFISQMNQTPSSDTLHRPPRNADSYYHKRADLLPRVSLVGGNNLLAAEGQNSPNSLSIMTGDTRMWGTTSADNILLNDP